MSNNRKVQSASARFGPAVKVLFLCGFIAGAGLGYVWQKTQLKKLGEQMKASETRLAELKRQNYGFNLSLAAATTRKELDARVKRLNLGLIAPQPDQIVRLRENGEAPAQNSLPTPGDPLRKDAQMYASRQ